MKKNISSHPLFVGNIVTSLVMYATNTLTIDFVMSAGTNTYQMQHFAMMIIAMITSIIVAKNKNLTEVAYKHFGEFMLTEAIMNLMLGLTTIIVGSPLIYVVSSVILTPFSKIQSYGINKVVSESFTKDERLSYDNNMATYSSYVAVVGLALGFILNKTINGPVAFALLCFVEIINNGFFYAAFKKIK